MASELAERYGPFDERRVRSRLAGGGRAPVRRGRAADARGRPRPSASARVLARLRGMPAPDGRPRGTMPGPPRCASRPRSTSRSTSYSPVLRGVDRATAGGRAAARSAGGAVRARDLLELATRGDDRPVRRVGRLGAAPDGGRRLRAGRRDQAGPADLPGGRSEPRGRRPAASSTSATTGPPMSSEPTPPAGGSPISRPPRPDSPFPASHRADGIEPELRLARLADLEPALRRSPGSRTRGAGRRASITDRGAGG